MCPNKIAVNYPEDVYDHFQCYRLEASNYIDWSKLFFCCIGKCKVKLRILSNFIVEKILMQPVYVS